MAFDPAATVIPFPNSFSPLEFSMGIDGIAMSCDFRYVCFHVFSGYDFYQNPMYVLRNSGKRFDAELETPGRHSHSVLLYF